MGCQWGLEQKSGSSVPTAAPLSPSYCYNCTIKETQGQSRSWLCPDYELFLPGYGAASNLYFVSILLFIPGGLNKCEGEGECKAGRKTLENEVKDGGEMRKEYSRRKGGGAGDLRA